MSGAGREGTSDSGLIIAVPDSKRLVLVPASWFYPAALLQHSTALRTYALIPHPSRNITALSTLWPRKGVAVPGNRERERETPTTYTTSATRLELQCCFRVSRSMFAPTLSRCVNLMRIRATWPGRPLSVRGHMQCALCDTTRESGGG